jgi:WD40 repeat protein
MFTQIYMYMCIYISNHDHHHTVLSTIAVAISPDGETVATSHGDHTIKIFKYYTGIYI